MSRETNTELDAATRALLDRYQPFSFGPLDADTIASREHDFDQAAASSALEYQEITDVAIFLNRVGMCARQVMDGIAVRRPRPEPAVPVSKSIHPDYLICLETGKKVRMLNRYLRNTFDMSPEDYRRKWDLPANYPMMAPNETKRRSRDAQKTGLGKGTLKPDVSVKKRR